MKKNLLLLLCIALSFPLLVSAKEVNVATASRIAGNWLPDCFYQSSTDFYHVFSGKNNQGWILISANDVIEPVIAYSEEGAFDINNIPPAFVWILEGVKEEIERKTMNSIPVSEEIRQAWLNTSANKLKNSQAVAPLLSTGWAQSAPYNNQCPLFAGNPSLTGCVATAMAQVMNFHKHPTNGIKNIPSYWSAGTILIPEITTQEMTYSWNTGGKAPVTDDEKKEVARLMYHVGASVKMTYSNISSSADGLDTRSALVNYFDYDASIHSKFKMYYTEQEWRQLIMKELDEGRPILCNGTSNSNSGHAFVCDGYNAVGFHFNWGWGPENVTNTYVSFSAMEYRNGVSAIMGIQPNKGLETFHEYYIFYMGTIIPGLQVSKEEISPEEVFTVDYPLRNTGSIDFKGKHGAVLVAEKEGVEEVVAVLGYQDIEVRTTELYRFNTAFECKVPSTVPSGTYWVQAALQPEDSEEWIFVKPGYEKESRLPLKVNNPAMPDVEKLLVTGKTWYVEYGNAAMPDGCYTYDGLVSFKVSGNLETSEDGKEYYEILSLSEPEGGSELQQWSPAGYLREEYGKVYAYDKDQTQREFLLYDFGLQEGDEFVLSIPSGTTPAEYSLTVEKVDEMEYDNALKKRIVFTDGTEWMEGLGSTRGLFYHRESDDSGLAALKACNIDDTMIYYNAHPEYCIKHSNPVFPETEAIWNIQQFYTPSDASRPSSELQNNYHYLTESRYGLSGDTIMNHTRYNKFYLLNDTVFNNEGKDIFLGGFRQIDGQVWCYLQNDKIEFMLYDFSKKEGESVIWQKPPYFVCADPTLGLFGFREEEAELKVHQIEQASYGRIFYLDENKYHSWIEGIGNPDGLFTYFFTYPLNFSFYEYNLACFKQGEEVIYLNNKHKECDSCFTPDIHLGIENFPVQSVSVIWNKEISSIEISGVEDTASFGLINLQGQHILRKNLAGGKQQVYISGLDKGLYIYQISNPGGIVKSGKVLLI
ncbi:MAG: thiol protease/hemagglutinin PrtT [Bacteroidales bacterium]|nr:thiol protease/hemagglutinin PrtT [Bacteroidales bacterium]